MQFETTNFTCALCKSALARSADAYPGPSRLCPACRRLVQTILPRAGLTAVGEPAPAMGALYDAQAVKEAVYANDAEDTQSPDNGLDYSGGMKEIESDFFRPEEESYYKTEFEIQPGTDEVDDFVEDFPGAPHKSVDDIVDDFSDRAAEEVAQTYGAQTAPGHLPPTTAPLTGKEIESESAEPSPVTAFAQGYDDRAVDPWENPLPAWDYSKSEYPVLIGPQKRSNPKKYFWIIVAGLLVVSFAIGYFILARSDAAQIESQPPDAVSKDDSAGAAAGQQNELREASGDTAQAQAPKPNASTEFGSIGSLTLQSAAFPDEAGAGEFSTKLIRAGIPAYVVPADLPRKGRWFRVRVGRFTNADDAKKYAVQSRFRAKAAGFDVDFIVVEYGKP